MLSVQIDEMPADLGEQCRAHSAAIHPGARSPRRGDLALEHDEGLIGVYSMIVEHPRDLGVLRNLEYSFDTRPVSAGADKVHARPLTQQQTQRADDDRLPCPG